MSRPAGAGTIARGYGFGGRDNTDYTLGNAGVRANGDLTALAAGPAVFFTAGNAATAVFAAAKCVGVFNLYTWRLWPVSSTH
jgi:hypothetical protein